MSKRKWTNISMFGTEIEQMRRDGLTRQEIADNLGLTKVQIKNWINRTNRAEAYTVQGKAAKPPAVRIFSIVVSCNWESFPPGCFTSSPTNRPSTQAIISGIPAVPYIPPWVFQQKHRGLCFKCRRIAATISFSISSSFPFDGLTYLTAFFHLLYIHTIFSLFCIYIFFQFIQRKK